MRRLPLLGLALAPHPGCGADDSMKVHLVSCAPGVMKLEGIVAGTPVALEDPAQGGYSQDNDGGDFQTQLGERGGTFDEPAVIDVRLKWSEGLLEERHPRPATGDARLPSKASAGVAGQTYCAGPGSLIVQLGEEIRFGLLSLRGGVGCTMPVEGELRGCWQLQPGPAP